MKKQIREMRRPSDSRAGGKPDSVILGHILNRHTGESRVWGVAGILIVVQDGARIVCAVVTIPGTPDECRCAVTLDVKRAAEKVEIGENRR